MTEPIQRVPRDLPAPTSATNVAKRLALMLASQIGYREGRSPSGDWNNDNAYGAYFNQNRVSWCNWFISWGAVAAGIPATVIPRTGYTPSSWNWFTSRDRDVAKPQAGDLFWVYGYVSSEGTNRVHHIGFVEKLLSEGRIQTIEGNTNTSGSSQGNGVYRNVRTIGPKLRFARPNYAAAIEIASPAKPTKPTPPPAKPVQPPTPEEDTMTPAQMQELKNHITKEVRRFSIWELRWLTQTEDERQEARAKYDAAIAAGKTPEQAAALVVAELAPLDADLAETQKKG